MGVRWVVVLAASLLTGCNSASLDAPNQIPIPSAATAAPYDAAAYVRQVQDALLGGFATDPYPLPTFADACQPPNVIGWVCAIGSIRSSQRGSLEVTLQPNWDGHSCQQLERNIANFTAAAKVVPPTQIIVVQPDGQRC